MRIGILAALPSELKPLVAGWKRQPASKFVSLWTTTGRDGTELVAACAGMGANGARRAFAAAEQRGLLDLAISAGLAGSTGGDLVPGQVCAASEVIDVQTGERFPLAQAARRLRLATVTATAGTAEKARLRASYGAELVDMEAATIARLAAMRCIPVCCFKAVSDAEDATLPEIDRFVSSEGQLHLPRFLAHTAVRPRTWPGIARLARDSANASRTLAERLREFLLHMDWEHTNATGSFSQPDPGKGGDAA